MQSGWTHDRTGGHGRIDWLGDQGMIAEGAFEANTSNKYNSLQKA